MAMHLDIYTPFQDKPRESKTQQERVWFVGMAAKSVNTQTPQEETIEIRPV
jgi:hypothetical protein